MKFIVLFLTLCSANTMAFDHSHKEFDQILTKHHKMKKDQALFNYKALKKSPAKLKGYLKSLEGVSKKEFNSWTKNEQLAFLINAYNAYTIKLIIDNYPLESIKDLGSLFSSPWKKEFIALFGKKVSLDNIEHDMIREDYKEPRIHFAVVCASIGCPNLQNKSFVASKLDEQFDKAAREFIDSTKNSLDLKKGELKVSKIFKWYGDDFNKKYKSYLHYIAPLLSSDPKIQKKIITEEFDIEWNDYDWNLNEVKK